MQRLGQPLDHVAGFMKLAALDRRVGAEGATDGSLSRHASMDCDQNRCAVGGGLCLIATNVSSAGSADRSPVPWWRGLDPPKGPAYSAISWKVKSVEPAAPCQKVGDENLKNLVLQLREHQSN